MAVKAEMATRVVALKVAMEAAAMVAAVPGVVTVAVKGLSPAAGPAEPQAPPYCKVARSAGVPSERPAQGGASCWRIQ